MLKISRLADYATVILEALSNGQPDHGQSASALAQETQLSAPTVSKILKQLHDAGIVNSERGMRGGYTLAKQPEKISLASIITAIDGRPSITECSHEDKGCHQDAHCALRGNWQLINFLMNDLLANVTLADMTQQLTVASYARVQAVAKEQADA